jgi:hypothetical protein
VDRRKLLQGSVAAPLVLTVSPALGVARTTFMSCAQKGAGQPTGVVAPLAEVPADEWLRVDLDVFQIHLTNAKGELVAQPGKYFVGPDRVTMFRLADVRPDSVPATPVQSFNAYTMGLQRRVVERRRALAYVDEEGEVVGFAWQPAGGMHMTASCHASVLGGLRKARIA